MQRAHAAVVLLAAVAYLALSTMWLGQPGPYYDEWIFVPVSLRTLGACDLEAAVTHHLGCLPLTQAPAYVGAIKAWAMAPILGVAGVGPWTVRLPPILLGLATLAWLHAFLRPRLGERASAWVFLLLAVDAVLVWHTRVDWGPFAIANACKLVAFASLWRWLDAGGRRDLAWLLLALCLGLFDKLNFLWMTVALGAATLALEPRALLHRLRTLGKAGAAMLALAIGLHAFAGIALVLPAMTTPLPGLPEPLPPVERLAALRVLYDVTFGGTSVHDWMFRDALPLPGWPSWVQGALMAAALVAGWITRKDARPAARLLRWSTALVLALLACLLATHQTGGSHHVAMLWPFPVLQAAALAVLAWQRRAGVALRVAFAAAIVAFIGVQATVHAAFVQRLAARGPYQPLFDPALADVAAHVRERGDSTVASSHWGLHMGLLALAGKDAHRGYRDWWPIFLEAPGADPARTAWLQREFLDGGTLAVVEWTAPALAAPTHVDAYLATWAMCARDSVAFDATHGGPLARVTHYARCDQGLGTSPSTVPVPAATSSATSR